MINRPKKFINLLSIKNSKYIETMKKFINTIFFLKYILLIFLVSFITYVCIPKFFDSQKREEGVKNLLATKYNITINKIPDINYLIFPSPRLIIKNTNFIFADAVFTASVKEFIILLNLSELYNFKDITTDQILIESSDFLIDVNKFKPFLNYVNTLANEINVKKSNIKINNGKKNLITLNKLNFNNKKNLILRTFLNNHKVQINFSNLKKQLIVDIPKMGVNANILFAVGSDVDNFKGDLKTRILNNNLQLSFKKEKDIEIYNSFFRSKNLNTSFDGLIKFNPYFDFDLFFNVKSMNFKFVNVKTIFDKILNLSESNQNINGKFKINYANRTYRANNFEKIKVDGTIENGNLNIKDSLFKSNNDEIKIKGNLKNYEQYKIFNFNLFYIIRDKNLFFKKLKIKIKEMSSNSVNINILGVLNLISKKINFNKIKINNVLEAREENIKFFKEKFESIVIKNNVLDILDSKKIKSFMREIL